MRIFPPKCISYAIAERNHFSKTTPENCRHGNSLLILAGIGLPPDCFHGRRGAQIALDGLFGLEADDDLYRRTTEYDQCVSGMFVQLASYFGIALERVNVMVKSLLENRMSDGGWNCRIIQTPLPSHSSFHTSINVLEGLREAVERGVCMHEKSVLAAEAEARELLLRHGLFRSSRTGEIIDRPWLLLSYPPRWHFDILRALDYFARADAKRDLRLKESVDLLISRRRPDGRWPVQNKHRALVYFDMEKVGSPSRWNTLRSLRVLRWWNCGSRGWRTDVVADSKLAASAAEGSNSVQLLRNIRNILQILQ
jgi:hypothetical protein